MRHPFFKPKNHIIWPFLAILVHIRDLSRPFLGRFASHGMQIPMKTGGDLSFNVALYQIWYEKSILKLVRPYNYQKNCRDEKWTLSIKYNAILQSHVITAVCIHVLVRATSMCYVDMHCICKDDWTIKMNRSSTNTYVYKKLLYGRICNMHTDVSWCRDGLHNAAVIRVTTAL